MANIINLAEKVLLRDFLLLSVEPSSAVNYQIHKTNQSIPDPFHSQIKDFQIHRYLYSSYPLNLGEA